MSAIPVPSTKPDSPPAASKRSSNISAVGWTPNEDMEYHSWILEGRRIGAMWRGSPWWIGDWIHYGSQKFGERYVQATRITGYDAQTLMNMVYVASRFEISRRRENLSWSHHETVAALAPRDQDRWLDQAAADRLSVADLRLELRTSRRATRTTVSATTESTAQPTSTDVLVCPHCGKPVHLS
jgi:hypothetical protein